MGTTQACGVDHSYVSGFSWDEAVLCPRNFTWTHIYEWSTKQSRESAIPHPSRFHREGWGIACIVNLDFGGFDGGGYCFCAVVDGQLHSQHSLLAWLQAPQCSALAFLFAAEAAAVGRLEAEDVVVYASQLPLDKVR